MTGFLGRILGSILLILFALSYFMWPFWDSENPQPAPTTQSDLTKTVEINWTWKTSVQKTTNVIYGTVRNKGQTHLGQVTLEFRTQNKSRKPISSYTFNAGNLPAGQEKPFRKDFIRTGTEDSGFVNVIKVVPK